MISGNQLNVTETYEKTPGAWSNYGVVQQSDTTFTIYETDVEDYIKNVLGTLKLAPATRPWYNEPTVKGTLTLDTPDQIKAVEALLKQWQINNLVADFSSPISNALTFTVTIKPVAFESLMQDGCYA